MSAVQGSRRAMQISDRRRMEDALKFSGALPDPKDVRARVQAEKLECPICFDPIHPDNWNKHMTLKHADNPVALHDSMPGRLSLAVIRMDGGTQPRAQIDEAVVSDYVEQMKDGVVFPAVTVFYDGANYWLVDGFHRVTAAKQTDETEILADVKQGTQRDAKLASFSANSTHGLRRTNSDKWRVVESMLGDTEWALWSDREIARQCAVSQPFVGKVRKSLSDNRYQIERKIERGGSVYTMKTDNIGSKPALSSTAPTALQVAVDNGVIGVREAVKAHDVLTKLPQEQRDYIAELTQGDVDRLNILARLYKTAGSPETNGTFDEIMTTGGFHYGDDLEKWCDFANDSIEDITKALQSIAKHHAREAMQDKPFPDYDTEEAFYRNDRKKSFTELDREYRNAARREGLPYVPPGASEDAAWKAAPEAKELLDHIALQRHWIREGLTWAANLGKLAPEAKPFVAGKLRSLAQELIKKADELESGTHE